MTPQTDDGVVSRVLESGPGTCLVEVAVPLKSQFLDLARGREDELVFASRSRLARLGIEVTPRGGITLENDVVRFEARMETTIPAYGVGDMLPQVVLPGLRVGRLVFCPPERALTSAGVLEAVEAGEINLPDRFSVDSTGRFTIQPHRRLFDLARPLKLDDLVSVVATAEGRKFLNGMQIARDVENIVLEPGSGIITSCSMFLHRHYVVIEHQSNGGCLSDLGDHLQAVVLDPVSTRGTRVFLEIVNRSGETIVNPAVTARIYEAMEQPKIQRPSVFAVPPVPVFDSEKEEFDTLRAVFDRLEQKCTNGNYFDRLCAVVDDWSAVAQGGEPKILWPDQPHEVTDIDSLRSTRDYSRGDRPQFGTERLREVADNTGATVLLGYFPNLVEHVQICDAALRGAVGRIVFRRASYEHGPFMSAKDQNRLADYRSLGVEVHWCNDDWGHVAKHVYRGYRGYFLKQEDEVRLRNALIISIYGSARPLSQVDEDNLRELLSGLKALFGEDLAILTGGGPGAMQQASKIAHSLGLLVGANYIETVDQGTNKDADFYQCFQDNNRHNRQRWFEIASFQIFCTGGLGTLEEIGLTLTDMKLGMIESAPLVFFGAHKGEPYWQHLGRQFDNMVQDGRAPAWIVDNVLLTDDPAAVPPFYKRILELG